MANRVICDGAAFRGLRNRYTGEPVEVEMVIAPGGRPLFHAAKRTYSTSDLFPTFEAAREAWNRRDGVSGLKGPSAPMTCAYTGAPLSPVRTPRGVYLTGGFDPNLLAPREEFLAKMRGEKPRPPVRVEPVRAPKARRSRQQADLTDESMAVVEDAARKAGVRISSGKVSMSGKRR